MRVFNSGTSLALAGRIESIDRFLQAALASCVLLYGRRFPVLEDSMARISLIETDQATPEVKEVYEQKLKGKPGNVQKALAHRPDMLKNFLGFYASVGRSLERRLDELIYIRVSMINGCSYCLQHHLASSKRVGLTPEDWSALKQGNYSRFREKRKSSAGLCREVDAIPTRHYRCRFQRVEEAFCRSRDRRRGPADWPGKPDQPIHRSAGTRAGNAGRKDLAHRQECPPHIG